MIINKHSKIILMVAIVLTMNQKIYSAEQQEVLPPDTDSANETRSATYTLIPDYGKNINSTVVADLNRRLQDYLANPVIPFHLWIRQIAKDRIIDAHRRHRVSAKRSIDREQPQPGKGPPDQSTIELANQFRDGSLTPAAAAAQKELAAQIESAVHLLRDNDREIILMRHYEQLDNQEIAQALGLSEPAASMRYLRALKRLREIINSMPRLNDYLQE